MKKDLILKYRIKYNEYKWNNLKIYKINNYKYTLKKITTMVIIN